LIALATPLVAAWRGRQHPLAAGATAAYVAFLVHVGVDWDWQLAAVGLAAFTCGAVLLVTARGSRSPVPGRRSRVALTTIGVALTGFALWSLNGSYPLGQARNAMDDGEWSAAAAHASAAVARDGSFSATAWQFLGEAQTALKNPLDARRSLRIAVRRDPSSWKAWYDLAVVARGAERREAARKALTLNPLGPETQSIARVARITLSSP
jgi:tetratricopeptide (TPR) repeat protein